MIASDPALDAGTMAEVLLARAEEKPGARAYCFLTDGEHEGPWLDYATLDREARAVAAALQDVAGPGDRALLVYSPGLAFVSAFFGCQYAGVVPVPAYPPRPGQLAQGWQALGHVAADCAPRAILADSTVAPFIPTGGAVPALAGLSCVATDRLDASLALRWRAPRFDPDALALLQYTSGSTSEPKGVMIAHRNLMHNQRVIATALEHPGRASVGVNWLPPYHDLGLIGGVLQTVYLGASLVLMSPLAFIQNPLNWVKAVSRYRADTSGGPNFGYDLCVQRSTPEERAALDLSNWSVAAIGSEPISPQTIEQFTAAFAPARFRPEGFYPCYGLAESTVFVTGGLRTERPVIRRVETAALEQGRAVIASTEAKATTLVGCGRPWLGHEVCVVESESRARLPDGAVGEIWVRGPSVAQGYWNRPELTEETFRARLATGDGPYLRTGDLGFTLGGELFVTGRTKDTIVIRGRNHYPHDIEATVQSAHPAFRLGCGAAFEVTRDGQARLVVVQEVERRCRDSAAQLAGDIRQAVAERHELQVLDVVLLEAGSIPKTSSGKVRRASCRAAYEAGALRTWRGKPA